MLISSALLLLSAVETPQPSTPAPLYFEPNQGQFPASTDFVIRGAKYPASITNHELLIGGSTRIAFGPPTATPTPTGLSAQPGISNYFLGSRSHWTLNVPAYSQARLENVYPGIDVIFSVRADTREVEYDFVVKPGADPTQISVRFNRPIRRNGNEVLLAADNGATLKHLVPRVHQQGQPVDFATHLDGDTLRFEIPHYDRSQTLTIDPLVTTPVATFTNAERIRQIAVDRSGAVYLTGDTTSTAPASDGVSTRNGPQDAFVMKLAPAPGNERIYSAYYGGSDSETGFGIATMPDGTVFLSGSTTSLDLPSLHAFRETPGNCYAARIAPTAPYSLVYSTYIDGRDCYIAVDALGAAYIAGSTSARVATLDVFNRRSPFAMKLAAVPAPGTGIYERVYSTLLFPTFLESSRGYPTCILVDGDGSAIIGGSSYETQFVRRFEGFAFLVRIAPTPGPDGQHPSMGLPGHRTAGLYLDAERGRLLVSLSYLEPPFGLDRNVAILDVLEASPSTAASVAASPPFRVRSQFAIASQLGVDLEAGSVIGVSPSGTILWSTQYQGPATRMLPSAAAATGTSLSADDDVVLLPLGRSIAKDGNGTVYLARNGLEKISVPAAKPTVYVDAGNAGVSKPIAASDGKPFTISGGSACMPGSYTTPVAFDWPAGTQCTITFPNEVPTADGSSSLRFSKWLDTGSTNPTRTIEAQATPQLYRAADFDLYYPVILQIEGQGTVEPSNLTFVKAGTPIDFVATPAPGWTSDVQFARLTGPYTLTVRFTRIAPYSGPLQFVPLEPRRLPGYTVEKARSFLVNLEWGATVDALNITAVPSGPLGYLRTSEGTTHSMLSSLDGRVRANAMLAHAWQGPVFRTLYLSATDYLDQLLVDSNGYFTKPVQGKTLAFYPITPCRLLDSRTNAAAPFTNRAITVTGSTCGIPTSAQAVSLNATAIPQGLLGYLTLWPSGMPARPVVSTLNATTGTVTANAAILKTGSNGAIEAYFSEPAHLVLDANGYFAPPGQPGALDFVPLPPCRVVDTRLATQGGPLPLEPRTERELNLQAGPCPIPPEAKAYSVNVTVIPSGPLGFLTLWAAGTPRPLTSTLNALDGTITSNAAIVATGTAGAINVYATDATHLIIDANGYFR